MLLSLIATIVFAQSLATPTLGHVFHTSSIRAINGIPGAATLGDPLLTGVRSATLSRTADSALVDDPDGAFLITGLRSASPSSHSLPELPARFRASFSRSGAILYSAAGFQFLSSLSENPKLSPLDIPLPTGDVTAHDFDGDSLLIAHSNGAIFLYELAAQSLRQLLTLPDVTAIARANNRIYAITAGSKSIQSFDPAGAPMGEIAAPVQPTRLDPIAGSHLLLLTNEPNQPLWVLNADSIFFVPAVQ